MFLFDRKAEVRIAGLTITKPRIAFSVDRQPDQSQVDGEIRIYNLSDSNETLIKDRGSHVRLDAGYPQTIGTLLDGPVQRIFRAREGLARVTIIKVGDTARRAGEDPVLSGVSSHSYAGEAAVGDIAADLAHDMALDIDLDELPADLSAEDYAVSGPSADALLELLQDHGASYYVDGDVAKVRMEGKPRANAPTIICSQDTGMIDSPTVTDEGVDVKMLLTPIVELGSTVLLRSRTINGDYYVASLKHAGDTREGAFETALDLREIA